MNKIPIKSLHPTQVKKNMVIAVLSGHNGCVGDALVVTGIALPFVQALSMKGSYNYTLDLRTMPLQRIPLGFAKAQSYCEWSTEKDPYTTWNKRWKDLVTRDKKGKFVNPIF